MTRIILVELGDVTDKPAGEYVGHLASTVILLARRRAASTCYQVRPCRPELGVIEVVQVICLDGLCTWRTGRDRERTLCPAALMSLVGTECTSRLAPRRLPAAFPTCSATESTPIDRILAARTVCRGTRVRKPSRRGTPI